MLEGDYLIFKIENKHLLTWVKINILEFFVKLNLKPFYYCIPNLPLANV